MDGRCFTAQPGGVLQEGRVVQQTAANVIIAISLLAVRSGHLRPPKPRPSCRYGRSTGPLKTEVDYHAKFGSSGVHSECRKFAPPLAEIFPVPSRGSSFHYKLGLSMPGVHSV